MTLLVGGKEAYKILIGCDTFVDQKNIWLPCTVNNDFSGTPILMHYDEKKGVTSFIGAVDITWSTSVYWNKTILTLPEGFHFIETDSTLPLGGKDNNGTAGMIWGNNSYYDNLTFSMSGNSVIARFNWNVSQYNLSGRIILLMSSINYNSTGYQCWTTTTVAPD